MKRKYIHRLSLSNLGLTGAALILTITNWRLVLTLCCGIAVMLLAYQYPQGGSPNKRLTWAIVGGSGSIFICYLLIMIFQSYPNGWIGLGEILELVAVFATLGLVLYQNLSHKRQEKSTNQLILYLASEDNLTRLIALRQLQQRAINQSLTFQQEQQLKEYCQIILEQSHPSVLANTALEIMEVLQFIPLKTKLKQPLNDLSLISSQEVA